MDSDIVDGLKKIVRKRKIVDTLNAMLNTDSDKDGEPEMTGLMKAAMAFLRARSPNNQGLAGRTGNGSGALSDLVEVFLGMS